MVQTHFNYRQSKRTYSICDYMLLYHPRAKDVYMFIYCKIGDKTNSDGANLIMLLFKNDKFLIALSLACMSCSVNERRSIVY